ncbi:MAG: hypothetical protein DME53_13060 [Verrucomicrobia bacterium]|nr:MAG: hypothetical protein DME53_13060 [Verrucomicrobiota bacterium]
MHLPNASHERSSNISISKLQRNPSLGNDEARITNDELNSNAEARSSILPQLAKSLCFGYSALVIRHLTPKPW